MRLRHKYSRVISSASQKKPERMSEQNEANEESIKEAKPVLPEKMNLFRRIVNNPNFVFQMMVILLTLTSDNVRMDRRIDIMASKIDALRSITDVINSTMQSVRAASEAPKHIRKLLQ